MLQISTVSSKIIEGVAGYVLGGYDLRGCDLGGRDLRGHGHGHLLHGYQLGLHEPTVYRSSDGRTPIFTGPRTVRSFLIFKGGRADGHVAY